MALTASMIKKETPKAEMKVVKGKKKVEETEVKEEVRVVTEEKDRKDYTIATDATGRRYLKFNK